MKRLLTAALCLCAVGVMALPASASGYTFGAPAAGNFGKPTSVETVTVPGGGAAKNEDVSKDAALAPPSFGTVSTGPAAFPGAQNVTAAPTFDIVPETGAAAGFTGVTDALRYNDGSLGTLQIPAIGLTVRVFEGTDSAALLRGAGHFTGTSIWNGNCCIAAHNRGVRNDFGRIHTLRAGDTVTLTTKLGTRTYAVSSVTKVLYTDTSGLAPGCEDTITLYTCVQDQPAYRWCVKGVRIV